MTDAPDCPTTVATSPVAPFPKWHDVARPYATASSGKRWVVVLAVGYHAPGADDGDDVATAREAGRWALDLTRDENSGGTWWWVYDRFTGRLRAFDQDDFGSDVEHAQDVVDATEAFGARCARCGRGATYKTQPDGPELDELPITLCALCGAYLASSGVPITSLGQAVDPCDEVPGPPDTRDTPTGADPGWLAPGGVCRHCRRMVDWDGQGWRDRGGQAHCPIARGHNDDDQADRPPHTRYAPGVTHIDPSHAVRAGEDLDPNLRGVMADGYDDDKVNEVFPHLSRVCGLWLACVRNVGDAPDAFHGHSQFYAIAPGGRLHAVSGELWAWLTGNPGDPDTPATPGEPSSWWVPSPTQLTVADLTNDDGKHNFALRPVRATPAGS